LWEDVLNDLNERERGRMTQNLKITFIDILASNSQPLDWIIYETQDDVDGLIRIDGRYQGALIPVVECLIKSNTRMDLVDILVRNRSLRSLGMLIGIKGVRERISPDVIARGLRVAIESGCNDAFVFVASVVRYKGMLERCWDGIVDTVSSILGNGDSETRQLYLAIVLVGGTGDGFDEVLIGMLGHYSYCIRKVAADCVVRKSHNQKDMIARFVGELKSGCLANYVHGRLLVLVELQASVEREFLMKLEEKWGHCIVIVDVIRLLYA
jgi:hypothetical protein